MGEGIEIASSIWEIGIVGFYQHQTDDQIVETGHHLSGISFGHTSSIFMQGDIPAIVQTILDAPVGTSMFEQLFRGDFFSG